jgi:peptide/nickel transport system substrate-binding protein
MTQRVHVAEEEAITVTESKTQVRQLREVYRGGGLSRSELLKRAGALGLSVGVLGELSSRVEDAAAASGHVSVARGGVLRFARNAEPQSFDPIGPIDNGSIWAQVQIFDQLVEILPGSPNPKPALAESWQVARGGLSYTFKLRDARFSDGTPVTAEDVKFSLDRFGDPKANPNYGFLATSFARATIVGPRAVRVDLKHVDGALLAELATFVASIVPKHAVTKLGDKGFALHPVGSGAFMLKSFARGQTVELTRNPHYWKPGRPFLDGISFQYVPDDNARILKIQSGGTDVAEAVPFAQIKQVDQASGVSVKVEPLASLDAIWLNHKKQPLGEVSVRQALNYATPKEAIRKAVLFGYGGIASSVIPKLKYWDASVPPYPYDPKRAKALLAKSSRPKGFSLPLIIPAGDVVKQQIATIIQQAWGEVGIRVSIQQLDLGSVFTKFFGGDYSALSFQGNTITSDEPVDDEFALAQLNYPADKSLFTFYNSAKASRLAVSANQTLSETRRRSLFHQLQRLAMQDAVIVPLFYLPARTALRDKVGGFHTVPMGWWRLEDVYLKA